MSKILIHCAGQEDHGEIQEFLKDHYPDELGTKTAAQCVASLSTGVSLTAIAYGRHIFVSPNDWDLPRWSTHRLRYDHNVSLEENVPPFIQLEVIGQAKTKLVPTRRRNGVWGAIEEVLAEHSYAAPGYSRWDDQAPQIPYAYLTVRVTAEGADLVEAEFPFQQPTFGLAKLTEHKNVVTVASDFYGLKRQWAESLYDLDCLYRHVRHSQIPDGVDAWWELFFEVNHKTLKSITQDTAGLTSTFAKKEIKPVLERLQRENPLDWQFFQWLQCSATRDKQINNRLLATFLQTVGSEYAALLKALRKARLETAPTTCSDAGYDTDKTGPWHEGRRAICLTLPGVAAKVQEEEAKHDWRKQQTNAGKAEGLGIDKDAFPKLRKAVEAGDIPASVFHQPNGDPINLEFDLWEKSLARKGWAPVIYEIAADASRRSTYEKDITPYLMFLFKVETYLKRHTGCKWTAMPKYVQSQWELEIDDSDNENGTSSKRSAFTPVADNETGIVTVPYVAVAVSGVRTQWCYARHYHVFEEGFTDPVSGGIITKDLSEKLNGRDDYGLCFYTLTGTVTARGYPTFLIIFERLKEMTRVHFHRVRPQRGKNGVLTPACRLIEACYQYMAGNVPASDIKAQQGDLILIQHPNDPIAAGAKVGEAGMAPMMTFESHQFKSRDGELKLYKSTAKTPANRLGFLHAPGGLDVEHPEHEHLRGLPAGWYEVRRCKSWEANPHAIWSLTID